MTITPIELDRKGKGMSEIPEDVMKAAQRATVGETGRMCSPRADLVVARAILAERERCAKIAEQQQLELVSTSAASEQPELTWRVAAQVMRDAIAQAIRSSHE